MKLIRGDMFAYLGRTKFRLCITTNGFVKNDGTAVMGRGNAAQARKIWAEEFNVDLPKLLGKELKNHGNKIFHLDTQLYTFPVKKNWFDRASKKLISKSAERLKEIAQENKDKVFILPRPGCGNGQLKWKRVKPLLEDLPNNVWIICSWNDIGWNDGKSN